MNSSKWRPIAVEFTVRFRVVVIVCMIVAVTFGRTVLPILHSIVSHIIFKVAVYKILSENLTLSKN